MINLIIEFMTLLKCGCDGSKALSSITHFGHSKNGIELADLSKQSMMLQPIITRTEKNV